jgi:hypothetical protein
MVLTVFALLRIRIFIEVMQKICDADPDPASQNDTNPMSIRVRVRNAALLYTTCSIKIINFIIWNKWLRL